jgi:hypothetical protein
MNKSIVKKMSNKDDLRSRAIAKLAIDNDIEYKLAEKIFNSDAGGIYAYKGSKQKIN